ncbi:MAG: peptide deformylase [Candidatus Omnitrophota bacterium]
MRKKSSVVKRVNAGERMLIASMIETMHQNKGVGLAAPQVGINEQIFVADVGNGPAAFINPRILKKSGSEVLEEGCLSIPGIIVKVKRPKKILVEHLDEDNQLIRKEYDELLARVILHETDHLKGKLITDYANLAAKIKLRPKLKAIRQVQKT